MPSYSKAPRGLFVLCAGNPHLHGPAISPSPSLRQCSSRYAIRAGRNLPDKGLRYLRTVIVTAAVHRGFSDARRDRSFCRSLYVHIDRTYIFPLNLPALGRRQPLYIKASSLKSFLSTGPVFLINQSVAPDTRSFQHIAKFYNGLKTANHQRTSPLPYSWFLVDR